jgi:glucokinase
VQGRQGIRPVRIGALDIGGTHVSAGSVDVGNGEVDPETRVRLPLPGGGGRSELLGAVAGAASSLTRIRGLGVAAPGPFDYDRGVSKIPHKLQGLYGVDLRSELAAATGLSGSDVHFLNDAEAFLIGEWWAGAARGHARAIGVTLGTGLGSAFLEEGRIVRTGKRAPAGGALYRLEFRGAPVEDTISSRALLAGYQEAAGEPVQVEDIATRAAHGEAAAREAFHELGRALGEFLAPWVQAFEPGCVVVGGSIARSWRLLEASLRAQLEPIDGLVAVSLAERLDDAPLLGAARYVEEGGG